MLQQSSLIQKGSALPESGLHVKLMLCMTHTRVSVACVCVDAAMYKYLCAFVLKELDLRNTKKKKKARQGTSRKYGVR